MGPKRQKCMCNLQKDSLTPNRSVNGELTDNVAAIFDLGSDRIDLLGDLTLVAGSGNGRRFLELV